MPSSSTHDPVLELYRQVKRSLLWRELTYARLISASDRLSNDPYSSKPFQLYHWANVMYNYYADMINYPDETQEALDTLLYKTKSYTGLEPEQALTIFQEVNQRLDLQMADWHIHQCKVSKVKASESLILTVGDLSIAIPFRVARKILRKCKEHQTLLKLVLRYELIGRSSSIFWSIDTSLYDRFVALDRVTRPLPTVECFASPFNYHLDLYCSAFEQDAPYGSQGSFFTYMEQLEEPARFIFNPPYTVKMINKGAVALVKHMYKHPESEFIALLPCWHGLEGTKLLTALCNSFAVVLDGGDYTLYDYATDKQIKGTRNSILVVNIGQNKEMSTRYALLAKKNLSEKVALFDQEAQKLKLTKSRFTLRK